MGAEDDRIVSDDSDLASISDNKLLLVSVDEEENEKSDGDFTKSDEELARMLQVIANIQLFFLVSRMS